MHHSISAFNQTVEKSHAWLKELKAIGNFTSDEAAYTALRTVLHTLKANYPPRS